MAKYLLFFILFQYLKCFVGSQILTEARWELLPSVERQSVISQKELPSLLRWIWTCAWLIKYHAMKTFSSRSVRATKLQHNPKQQLMFRRTYCKYPMKCAHSANKCLLCVPLIFLCPPFSRYMNWIQGAYMCNFSAKVGKQSHIQTANVWELVQTRLTFSP
jgi:hypothetical protein